MSHAEKKQVNKRQSVANSAPRNQSDGATYQLVDNRPEAVAQRKLQEIANNSPRALQLKAFQHMAHNSPQAKQAAKFQSLADNHPSKQQQPTQKKASPEPNRMENKTGLPANLKAGIESLSGHSMDDVKVHYNSDKPAQLKAHAYAQGADIHLGPGQEKHLPHEAWHVVQQKQGRVKPTLQMQDKVEINDNSGLEKEADIMGDKAMQLSPNGATALTGLKDSGVSSIVVQRSVGFEFETGWYVRKNTEWQKSHPKSISTAKGILAGGALGAIGIATNFISMGVAAGLAGIGGLIGLGYGANQTPEPEPSRRLAKGECIKSGNGFTMEADDAGDDSEIEFVVQPPINESAGPAAVGNVMTSIVTLANLLNAHQNTPNFTLNTVTGNQSDAVYTIYPQNGVIAANAQVTAGVRLDRITSLAQNSQRVGTMPNRLMGMEGGQGLRLRLYNNFAQGAVQLEANQQAFPGNRASNDLVGLVTLLVSYLIEGAAPQDQNIPEYFRSLPYVKHLAILMARTDFATLFDRLPAAEKVYFVGHPARWVAMIMNGAIRAGHKDWQNGSNGRVIAMRIMDQDTGISEDSPVQVTRNDWLRGILKGQDHMSAANFSRFTPGGREMRGALEGMGRLGNKTDTVGTGRAAPEIAGIFEFRKVETHMPYTQWRQFAIDAYNYVVDLNRRRRR